MPGYLLVLTRDGPPPPLSAAAIGGLTGQLVAWVETLRRWRLVTAMAVAEDRGAERVRGCLLIRATDLDAARRLAAGCPTGAGGAASVLAVLPGAA